jgi:predicted nucleic-acid-binding protein
VIGVDSNVLLRHILQDDAQQSAVASRFFAQRSQTDPAFISRLVLAETIWTLARSHRYDASAQCGVVRALLSSADVVVEKSETLRRTLADAEEARTGVADAIIAHTAIDAGCDGVVTFDKRAQRLPGMLPVG